MDVGNLQIIPVKGMGLIQKGDDLARIIADCLAKQGAGVEEQDVVIITSKVMSKAEGRIIPLSTVTPGRRARALAKISGRDPKICELILRNSAGVRAILPTGVNGVEWAKRLPEAFPCGHKVVEELFAKEPTMIQAELVSNGFIVTDAGIDGSNVEGTENAILLPEDTDASCRRVRKELKEITGKTTAVIIADTDIRYERFGSVDQAIGCWGIPTIASQFGQKDLYGKPKIGGVDCIVDQMCNAAGLLMGNCNESIPVVVVRGYRYEPVERGMARIQVPSGTVLRGVFFNIWCDLKYWFYSNIAGA